MGNDRTLFALNTGHRATRATRTGKGWAVFENATKEKVFVGALPYPNEARFKEEKSDLPYLERMQSWMQESMQGNTERLPSVFVGHLFVAGGAVSDSEREIDLGGARAVPPDALPKADYIALGHLHKKQKMGKGHCYYSGSPLQYSFDESADKGVKVFTLNENGVETELLGVALTKLNDREREIMELRYGLNGGEEKTQREVAYMLGISQSYISRLEKKIIVRLKKEFSKMV